MIMIKSNVNITSTASSNFKTLVMYVDGLDHIESIHDYNNRVCRLLMVACNNMTRQSNFFKLQCELLQNIITEEEYDKEINEHESDYVVPCGNNKDEEDAKVAYSLCNSLIERVDSVNELCSLFELDFNYWMHKLRKIEDIKELNSDV